MRIVVANLTSGGLSGGYRKYLARLMPLIADDPRVTRLSVFVPDSAAVAFDSSLDVRPWSPGNARRGYASLTRDVARIKPDVVFVPTARYAAFGSTPVVTMVRNMEPLAVPFGGNSWTEGLKNIARAIEARRACRRSSRVIAVSNHVRDFIISRWQLDPERVGTAYHGVDAPRPPANAPEAERPRVLFTAGSIRPARGLEDAVRALALLEPGVRLVIAGGIDPGCAGYAGRLRSLAAALGVSGRITWAGELSPDAMEQTFRECAMFVMTSRAEACPNTVLEALSCGCPSVSVDHPPMPEFFGGSAQYYARGDARSLADRLRSLLDDPDERTRLARIAADRSRLFTWQATRDRTLDELERALA